MKEEKIHYHAVDARPSQPPQHAAKKKAASGALWVVCLVVCIGVFVFAGYKLYDYWHESRLRENYAADLMADAVTVLPPQEPGWEEETLEEREKKAPSTPIYVNFDRLKQQSEDIVGWIYSADTLLNYPVAQAADNDYYLRRMLDGSYNYGGTIFMDYRSAADASDWCTIIYGHSMQDDTMFGNILDYKSQKYYDEHPVLWYFTPEQAYRVELLGGYLTDAYSEVYIFPQDAAQRDALAALVQSHSTFRSGVTLEADSRLLMLSTCSYETEDSRYVLLGKLVPVEKTDLTGENG